jgi:GDP-mannose 6-dehydrogenase
VGIDTNPVKVNSINSGQSPIAEAGVAELIREMVACGRLRACTPAVSAIEQSELSLVCVGTPSNKDGSPNLTSVQRVCRLIGSVLQGKSRHTVVIRSTMPPGSTQRVVVPALESSSGKCAGHDFSVCVNPEFLREGTSICDFYAPAFTLIGADSEYPPDDVCGLYSTICAPLFVTSVKTAEMVKYACNCFHALKVTFANEIGNLCKGQGLDSHEVMHLFCQDTKLNLSAAYLKPGFAFGGSCLPKDIRAILHQAGQTGVSVPLLTAILPSNRLQIERAVDMVLGTGKERVGVLGLSFKPGTDDLRESPLVLLIEALIDRGLTVTAYDRDVSLSRLVGANKDYAEAEIPHISEVLKGSIGEVLKDAQVLVIGSHALNRGDIEAHLRADHLVIDLVRYLDGRREDDGTYQGICW